MTIVSVTGTASTVGTPTISQAVPGTVQDGDIGVAIIHQNTTTNTFTPPTGWTLVETRGPLSGNNCITYLLTKNTPFAASDAGSNVTGSFTTPSPHCGIVLAVLRGVTLDGTPVGFSDDTADTSMVFGSFTPTGNGEDALILAGVTTTSAQGVYTVTPPSGWTEDVDTQGGFTSGANTGVWAGHLSLTGGGGSAQSIGNGTATKNVRMNAWAIPLAAASVSGSVTAVAAAGAGAAVIPAVSGEVVISGGGPAASTAGMFIPLLSVDATVTATAATCTSSATGPTLTAGATVAATHATVTTTARAPVVTAAGSATVAAVAATASNAAGVPAVTGIRSPTVTAVPAATSTQARIPAVAGAASGAVTAVAASSTSLTRPPTVTATSPNATVTVPRATVTLTALAPTVSDGTIPQRDITITVTVGTDRWGIAVDTGDRYAATLDDNRWSLTCGSSRWATMVGGDRWAITR